MEFLVINFNKMCNSLKKSIVFLYTGNPLPAMLDMICFAKECGLEPLLILLDRGQKDLIIDSSLLNYEVVKISVKYRKVDFRRIISFPKLLLDIFDILKQKAVSDAVIITAAFDLLLLVRIGSLGKKYRIRHQVRDLHSLQLRKSFIGIVVRFVEKLALKNVEKVIVSSPKFASEYYEKIFKKEIVILENIPPKIIWNNFERDSKKTDTIVIGYIGILRYKEALFSLIQEVRKLVQQGLKIKIFFAGGGIEHDLEDVRKLANSEKIFEFHGPYEYSKNIKELYKKVDLIYAVYDENDRNCQIAMPNKYYESILSKTPILVADNTFVGEMVKRNNIGEVVRVGEENQLAELLKNIFDSESWYQKSLKSLDKINVEAIYSDYDRSIRSSVT